MKAANCARDLDVNGLRFVRGVAALRRERSKSNYDADGYYQQTKGGVRFFDQNEAPVAFLAIRGSTAWFVTMSRPPALDGKLFYMFALSDSDAARLGFCPGSVNAYRLEHDSVESVLRQLEAMGSPVADAISMEAA